MTKEQYHDIDRLDFISKFCRCVERWWKTGDFRMDTSVIPHWTNGQPAVVQTPEGWKVVRDCGSEIDRTITRKRAIQIAYYTVETWRENFPARKRKDHTYFEDEVRKMRKRGRL